MSHQDAHSKDDAARQLFAACEALLEALYWPGSDTAYVHSDTVERLTTAYTTMAQAWAWQVSAQVALEAELRHRAHGEVMP